MINSAKMPKAYSEVYSLINALGDSYINKIPNSIYNTIKIERDINYNPKYESRKTILVNNISYEGLSLISAINLQYWCNDQLEKNKLKEIYSNNTKLENEKYNYDNLFKKPIESEVTQSVALVEYKEKFFSKIVKKIKTFLKKKSYRYGRHF